MIRLRRFFSEIGFAVFPALLAAALHLIIVTVRREVFGATHWDWNTRDVGWMLAAGYLLIFALCALPLAALAAVFRSGLSPRARTWYWSALTTFAVLLLFTRVHSVAWLLVALGAGYQVSHWAASHTAAWNRAVRRAGIALVFGFSALSTTVLGYRAWKEWSLRSALGPSADGSPNVILVIWDTVRAQNLSLYGHHRPTTPFLDSLARRAVVFEHAYATAPWTLPSHASMLTGKYPMQQSGDRLTPLDNAHRTLPETLFDHGYATGGFVANLIYMGHATGLHRGFTRYEGSQRTLLETFWSTTLTQAAPVQEAYDRLTTQRWYGGALASLLRLDWRPPSMHQTHDRKEAGTITQDFLRWRRSVRRPYFAMLNYMEAHGGHRAPTRTLFSTSASSEDEYDGSIWWLDRELRRLVTELQRNGDLQRSILIVTSDHGEQFGEHGLRAHGNSLYSQALHVPLVIYAPGRVSGGIRVQRSVSLRDLARTVLDLAGLPSKLPGASLSDLVENPAAPASPVVAYVSAGINWRADEPVYWGDMIAALDDTLHVIRDGRGHIEAYAYRADTGETVDLAADPVRRALAEKLLEHIVRSAGLEYPADSSQRGVP